MKSTILTFIIFGFTLVPLFGQADQAQEDNLRFTVWPEIKSFFHSYETGLGLGGRVGFENDQWSFSVYHYQLFNNVERGSIPVSTVNSDNSQIFTDQFTNISLSGIQGGKSILEPAGFLIRLNMQLGMVSTIRNQKYSVVGSTDPEGRPLGATDEDINIGRDVYLTAEPIVSFEKNIGRNMSAGINAGYLLSTRSSSEVSGFSNFNIGFSIGYRLFQLTR